MDLIHLEDLLQHIHGAIDVELDTPQAYDDKILNQFIQNYLPDSLAVCVTGAGIHITPDIDSVFTKHEVSRIAIVIKEKGQIRTPNQVDILILPFESTEDNDIFDKLRSIISFGLIPIFDTISLRSRYDSDSFINITRKKFNELSSSLQNLQEKIQVPDLLVSVHPFIKGLQQEHDNFDEATLIDSNLLNEITAMVNGWIKQIQSVTSLTSDLQSQASIADEIQFWNSLDISITSIQSQLNALEVKNSINLLNRAKRFHVTLSFNNDTNLADRSLECKVNLALLKDLPISDLVGINSKDPECLTKLNSLISSIFNHLKRLRNVNNFPLEKALILIELALKDIVTKASELFSSFDLLTLDLNEFMNLYGTHIETLFDTVDLNVKYMINLIRELLRKRHEKFIIVRINQASIEQLKEKWDSLKEFRLQHESLLFIIRNFLKNVDEETKLTTEYNRLTILNPFDFSKHGIFNWSSTEKLYSSVYTNIQGLISSKLNGLFEDCNQMNEYVAVAEKYKYLTSDETFNILKLMKEDLRMKILESARLEINSIIQFYSKNSLKVVLILTDHVQSYDSSSGDNEEIIASILRALSLKDKFQFYEKNLSSLVGNEWYKYSIGNRLKDQMSGVLSKLDSQTIFNEFLEELSNYTNSNKIEIKGSVLRVLMNNQEEDIILNLNWKFFYYKDTLLQLSNMGFRVPVSILLQFQRIDKLLPVISDLDESLKSVKRILNHTMKHGHGKNFEFLIESDKQIIEKLFISLKGTNWEDVSQAIDLQGIEHESNMLEVQALNTVLEFQSAVNRMDQKLNTLVKLNKFLDNDIYYKLKHCEFKYADFELIIDRLTQGVNEIYIYENLDDLTKLINKDVKEILCSRCEDSIVRLSNHLARKNMEQVTEENETPDHSTIEVIIASKDQSIVMEPSLDDTKVKLVSQVNETILTVETLVLFHDERFTINNEAISTSIVRALSEIDSLVNKVQTYFSQWCTVDALINLNLQYSEDRTKFTSEDSLQGWFDSLNKVLSLRAIFENSSETIGNCSISLGQVQARVGMKFDNFQRQLISAFGDKFQESINDFDRVVSNNSKELSFNTLESTNFIANLITYIQTRANLDGEWKQYFQLLLDSSKVFQRFNFKFPSGWTYVEQIENKISAITSIVDKKQHIIDENLDLIKARMISLAMELGENTVKFKDDWFIKRPISGEMNPVMVLNLLNNFSKNCTEYLKTKKDLVTISEFLKIELPDINLDILKDINTEIADFKQVWSSINALHEQIESLRKLRWSEVKPRDIRSKLENLLENCRSLPIKIRQYSAFDDIQQTAKSLMKQQKYLVDLKNENIKDRHWKKLLGSIGYQGKDYLLFTLRDIWDLNLPLHEQAIKTVAIQANNERTLEENITKIKDKWALMALEFFNYNTKIKLVRSWDNLFENCNQDLSELTSMRNSSSFGAFEQDVSQMESKLNSFYLILDVWIEVQRQWVYLEGMFGSKNNISNILPVESARFNNLTYEFLDLMKKIYKVDLAIDIFLIADIEISFEKLLESFSKLRRSLSEFLEKQRDVFPRFYFVGNEDLLELIGSGLDFTKVNAHISKLFSGVAAVTFDKETSSLTSISSPQGETLPLSEPVSLIKFPALVEWLRKFELEIKLTISHLVKSNLNAFQTIYDNPATESINDFIEQVPSQVIILCCQISFTRLCEQQSILSSNIRDFITILSNLAATSQNLKRKKIENLLIELLHQYDVSLQLEENAMDTPTVLASELLYYYDSNSPDPLACLKVKHFGYVFNYGLEYLGVPEKLVHTPLVNRAYLTMTQALGQRLGGSPFGPAGTGKTETIKSLGDSLGKMVSVFCCDESFDYQSMSRIFLGLCKVGCWGCFDEFNRLDEQLLSAVSSQIESIEVGLKSQETTIELSGKRFHVHPETGLFVTMNPGYVGRNELPENLKKLFRSCSMEKPDKEIIIDVLLASQGFEGSKELARVIVPFFDELESLTSNQNHYDFGLRALKSVLNTSGKLKRSAAASNHEITENLIILRSIQESILPKLIRDDETIFMSLVDKHFPGVVVDDFGNKDLVQAIKDNGHQKGLKMGTSSVQKVLQLQQIQNNHHGIILVGDSGSGKTTCWNLLLETLETLYSKEHVNYVIDAKVLDKDNLYGHLDPVTREWSDGILTSILRKIKSNLRGEMNKESWVIFDGDIDPEWAENLNSVLDDNKLLTLPNGERLELPPNMRIIFETDNLRSTTLATISRCGMIWFEKDIVDEYSIYENHLFKINQELSVSVESDLEQSKIMREQEEIVKHIKSVINEEILALLIHESKSFDHIMDFNFHRYIASFMGIFRSYCRKLLSFCLDNKTSVTEFKPFLTKSILLSTIWSFSGDTSLDDRIKFGTIICKFACFKNLTDISENVIDYDISVPDGEWVEWRSKVGFNELEPHKVAESSTVVPTTDTVRHESLIYSVLNDHKTLLLCGPPGSGKTMTFLEVLKKTPGLDVLQLNFSKESSPEDLMKSLNQHCQYQRTSKGLIFTPKISGKWVVVFCDEINLPGTDKYGCQRVISLMRQMIEHQGFWDSKGMQWVKIANIQFVGACNSPKDPGRQKLSERFLRHVTLLMVDYQGQTSLEQIYETFNSAVMKCAPDLRGYTKAITKAMIEVYTKTKNHLSSSIQAHYVYSPRELTRWSRGLLEALKSTTYLDLQAFIRLFFHEGLRLFYDRLVSEDERTWTLQLFSQVITESFPFSNLEFIMKEPVLFSDWLSLKYESVDKDQLQKFISHRLSTFSEEEIDVDLVLYEDLLVHSLRIDRVLRQPQGHMILVGPSTSGKTTLTKFVAWMNGLKTIQLNVYSNYTIKDFDKNLREILIRCCRGEQICFIIDESSIIETSFIERMNTLLANSEIPGLFEDDDYKSLMNICLEESQNQGLLLDSNDELYQWFSQQISVNLHVFFTITELSNSKRLQVVSSPALFNRCVLSYMGDWSLKSLYEIGSKRIEEVPVDASNFELPATYVGTIPKSITNLREMLIDIFIFIHSSVKGLHSNQYPGKFTSFITNFAQVFTAKQFEMEESQRHFTNGLNTLRETVLQVAQLREELSGKQKHLTQKDSEARTMLNAMLSEQNEAERKQEFSITAQEELNKQEKEIDHRRTSVMADLAEAEPAILEAKKEVQNIKKQHLSEIRSMANPPAAVKMTMESVCILIGYEVTTWRDVQLAIRRDDFIPNIVNYSNEESLTAEIKQYMQEVYLSRPDYNFENVNRASKACGPLVQWVRAQIVYSTALDKVGPLKDEVKILESGAKKTKAQLKALEAMVKELQESIESYKTNYSSLIRETESIKMEMESVESKVSKSVKLLQNLNAEKDRWKNSTIEFNRQNERVIGNSILASAFLVYCGMFDQRDRGSLMNKWKHKLTEAGIGFDNAISMLNLFPSQAQYLEDGDSKSDKTLDDLSIENIIIIKDSKTPLIIDPSSQILDLLSKVIGDKFLITSFLSDSFIKDLENAIRFGGILLIKDSEYYNPILDSVLRGEIHRNGGRLMINIRDQLIDYDSNFKLVMYTRDPLIKIPAFVEARVATVNFTITSKNLESQILNLALKATNPELEQKRTKLMILQSQYKEKLNVLEVNLLNSLSQVSGSILDDEKVIEYLEKLKEESKSIDSQIEESQQVLEDIDFTRNKFFELAEHSSLIFDILKRLNQLNYFYSFSLETFTGIFHQTLRNMSQSSDTNEYGGKNQLVKGFYKQVFAIISPSLTRTDKIIFATLLTYLYYNKEVGTHFGQFMKGIINSVDTGRSDQELPLLLKDLLVDAKGDVDEILAGNSDNETISILTNVLQAVKKYDKHPEALFEALGDLGSFLYSGLGHFSSKYDDLEIFISEKVDSRPLLLTSIDGYDPSFKVEQLSQVKQQPLHIVSLGSKEGIEMAKRDIQSVSSKGGCLLIQNIQMSPDWLNNLQQIIETIEGNCHENFKLFMTCNLTSKMIPIPLINACQVMVFELETNFKRLLLETFEYYDGTKLESRPPEYRYIYFLLTWYHTIIVTRLKYVPKSFSKIYDINDSDFAAAFKTIDNILVPLIKTGTNISPTNIPFDKISYIIGNVIYGAKMELSQDLKYLANFAEYLFNIQSFETNFNLVLNQRTQTTKEQLSKPDGITTGIYRQWINDLPDEIPYSWIDIPDNINDYIMTNEGKLISKRINEIL